MADWMTSIALALAMGAAVGCVIGMAFVRAVEWFEDRGGE